MHAARARLCGKDHLGIKGKHHKVVGWGDGGVEVECWRWGLGMVVVGQLRRIRGFVFCMFLVEFPPLLVMGVVCVSVCVCVFS